MRKLSPQIRLLSALLAPEFTLRYLADYSIPQRPFFRGCLLAPNNGSLGSSEAQLIAHGMRDEKHINPMIGIICAYLMTWWATFVVSHGCATSIRRIARRFRLTSPCCPAGKFGVPQRDMDGNSSTLRPRPMSQSKQTIFGNQRQVESRPLQEPHL